MVLQIGQNLSFFGRFHKFFYPFQWGWETQKMLELQRV